MLMQQGFAQSSITGFGAEGGPEGAEGIIGEVLLRTEENFLSAGSDLVSAVDGLRGLFDLFDRLRVTFGPETGDRLVELIGEARLHVKHVNDGFDSFVAASEAVRLAVRGVRSEVGDLDRVVRTIANVSINARIQGNGLIPPRPQVAAFIEQLAVMVVEAEAILDDVREAMAGIGAEMSEMDAVTQGLRDELGERVLPDLGRFDRMAQGVLDRQGAMVESNLRLSDRMVLINSEVARLVVGLQSGDSTRQRLERVKAILSEARPGPLQTVQLQLVETLSKAAVETASEEIELMVKAAETVRNSAEAAIAQAKSVYVERTDRTGEDTSAADGFAESIGSVQQRLGQMRLRSDNLRERLGAILRHETALRQIGHQVRLSGLNAVLICAKLGEEGRALRELAQWLRSLTDESDAIVLRLQTVLEKTAVLADRLSGESIGQFETALQSFFVDAGELAGVIGAIETDREEAARVFSASGRNLPTQLGNATQALMRFQLLLRKMVRFDAHIATRLTTALPAALDDGAVEALTALRKKYTMQAERDIHDRIVGSALGALSQSLSAIEPAVMAAAKAEAEAEAEVDDLDDVLF